ncbi:MAG: diguanylate cyclase [Clostridia bacterium]|nr:diguanylate cyclase [Clostridia bacterium]
MVARVSGDEFIVISHHCETPKKAEEIMARIHKRFNRFNGTSSQPFELSISVGYSIYGNDSDMTFDALIQVADAMLYENKSKFKRNMGAAKRFYAE